MKVVHGKSGLTFIRLEDGTVRVQWRQYTEEHGVFSVLKEEDFTPTQWCSLIVGLAPDYGPTTPIAQLQAWRLHMDGEKP